MEPLKLRALALAWIVWMGTPLSGQDEDCRASGILSLAASPPPLPGREYHIESGEVFHFTLEARLETHFEGDWGVQGFSLSVAHDAGVLEITGATQEGTDADEVFRPLGFERIETVDNETGEGFVCAVVLSLVQPVTLPPEGFFSLARASYRALVLPEDSAGVSTTVEYRDGLRGSAQPVRNRLTWNGRSVTPCVVPFSIRLTSLPPGIFLRGDFDGGGSVDISDAVAVIGYLFLAGRPPGCFDAADANDDGRLDIADPIFGLDFLFRGGAPPPVPFPLAGPDPTEDGHSCSSRAD